MKKNSKLVYSTDKGRIKTSEETQVNPNAATDGIIRLKRETKGRGGKGVTIATGFDLEGKALKDLAKKLKQLCGTGGTVKDGQIEIQSDQREKMKEFLEKQGFSVKLAGG